jgi:serine protease Do
MSGTKYIVIVLALVLGLILSSSGCALFRMGDEEEDTTYEVPDIQYGSSDALVELIPADFTPVVEEVAPAVVRIVTETIAGYWFWQPIPRKGIGTGVIYDSDGYILTNKHVVEGARSVTVYRAGVSEGYTVNTIWEAPDTDLAVLKIDGDGLPIVEFSPTEELGAYQWVIAIGYPFDIGGAPTVSEGIISALGRSIQLEDETVISDVIQTTAAINPGNSGGPLVDLSGRVIGINTAILGEAENIGFSISVTTVEEFIHSLVVA